MPNRATYELSNKTQRAKLAPRSKPYFFSIEPKLTLGYVRHRGAPGHWLMRRQTGRAMSENGIPYSTYTQAYLGQADDAGAVADGAEILSFEQAKAKAAGRLHTGPVTVKNAVDRYVESIRADRGDGAAKDAEQRLEKHVTDKLGIRRVADLTLTELRAWRDELVARKDYPVSHSTANRIMANLKAALNGVYADEKNGIPSNRAWSVLEAFKGADQARQDHFEVEDVQSLIDAARNPKFSKEQDPTVPDAYDPAFANLLAAGFLTGARYGELTACDVRHFDAKHGTLTIPSGKTGARPVTLTADGIEFFKSIAKGRDRTAPLFAKEDGERWGKSEQHRRIKEALKAAKLPTSASFYSLRHSYISRAIEEDVPVFIIARNCGTSETMIRKHYAHLLAKKERVMLERAAKAFKLVHGGKHVATA
ncbi:MAG: tyrosine-type recombinase/integrase [Betaproteobacteria bacterium]|nr:tyrosine-type recombinase/integrase [Betaproteobacteria bacterium]